MFREGFVLDVPEEGNFIQVGRLHCLEHPEETFTKPLVAAVGIESQIFDQPCTGLHQRANQVQHDLNGMSSEEISQNPKPTVQLTESCLRTPEFDFLGQNQDDIFDLSDIL